MTLRATSITATSTQQVDAAQRGELPQLDAVRDGLFAIPIALPDHLPPYTYVYAAFASDGAIDLVDAGVAGDAAWHALVEGLEQAAREVPVADTRAAVARVRSVTLTHLHRDHTGLAARLRERSGAAVRMHPNEAQAAQAGSRFGAAADPAELVERWGIPAAAREEFVRVAEESAGPSVDPSARTGDDEQAAAPFRVDELLEDGAELRLGDRTAVAIHTPGHTSGHLCLALPEAGIVFTGDHVLPVINPGIALGGVPTADPLGDYYASLARIAATATTMPETAPEQVEALPGHGFRFAGVAERCAEIRAHHEARSRAIARVYEVDPQLSVWELASRIEWSGGWAGLSGVARYSALAQTEIHLARLSAAARTSTD